VPDDFWEPREARARRCTRKKSEFTESSKSSHPLDPRREHHHRHDTSNKFCFTIINYKLVPYLAIPTDVADARVSSKIKRRRLKTRPIEPSFITRARVPRLERAMRDSHREITSHRAFTFYPA